MGREVFGSAVDERANPFVSEAVYRLHRLAGDRFHDSDDSPVDVRQLCPGCRWLGARRDCRCMENLRYHMQRSEEHTSELQSLMRISYAVFCLKKKKNKLKSK